MILVDTAIWFDWSNKKEGREAIELDRLMAIDEVTTTDIVIAEVLQGARTQTIYEDWFEKLSAFHYLPITQEIWLDAARISFELRQKGATTPLSDLLVASVALKADIAVYTTDNDFLRVPGLKLHQP